MDVKSKFPTNCKVFVQITEDVDQSLMTSFLAVNEFYHVHETIGVLLQKIATSTFSAVGCFLHLSSFRQSQLSFYGGARIFSINIFSFFN